MFANKDFNFFVFGSALVHMIFILFFNIHVAPSASILSYNGQVSFLGYFMGDVRPNLNIYSDSGRKVLWGRNQSILQDFNSNIETAVAQPKKLCNDFFVKPFVSSPKSTVKDLFMENILVPKMDEVVIKDDTGIIFTLQDGLQYSSVLYRPKAPSVRNWVEIDTKHLSSVFDLSVDPNGKVREVKLVKSSGYTEADSSFIRYLQQWLFVPLGTGDQSSKRAGRIRITVPIR